jgi:hypothetical protein
MAYLFAKDNVLQSLRLGFAGAWAEVRPDLSNPLLLIETHCPQLLRSFVPPSERIIEDDDDSGLGVAEDNEHTAVNVDLKGYHLAGTNAQRMLRIPRGLAGLTALPSSSPFCQSLRQAFRDGTNLSYTSQTRAN